MAKKSLTESLEPKKKGSLFDLVKKVDNSAEILAESVMSKINDWIPTGSYILNACISGSLFGGIPSGRITTLCGSSSCGKSFLATSICREAQAKGYTVLYLDSENAIDETFVKRLGCDTSNFIIKQVSSVNEVSTFLLNFCRSYQEAKKNGEELSPFIVVLDSLGNLQSAKEAADAAEGKHVQDFSRSKEIKKLFRLVTVEVAKCHAPLVVVNHTYTNAMAFIPTQSMSGGSGIEYAGTVTLMMSGSKLDDKDNEKEASKRVGAEFLKRKGIKVTCYPEKSRLSIGHKVAFTIPLFCPPNPYIGLSDYLNWDNAGITVGVVRTQEEYDKMKPNEQTECVPFEYTDKETGETVTRYAIFKKALTRGVGIICKHLGRAITPQEFLSPVCFTDEFLHFVDEKIIKPEFELPSRDSFTEIAELTSELGLDSDDSDNDE